MKKLKFLLLLACLSAIMGMRQLQDSLFKKPAHFPEPNYAFKGKRVDSLQVLLGRALFYDEALSIDFSTSCASCHSPFSAFTHNDHEVSHGIQDRFGKRNSPPLFNLAWQPYYMWDGAINNLDVQALAPINHPDEMGESTEHVLKKIKHSWRYRSLFNKVYGDTLINSERMLKSISSFLVTLVSAESKYDRVMLKKDSFNLQEQNGYTLFKNNCNTCHTEPLFTSFNFENNGIGMLEKYRDLGRAAISGDPQDSLRFKVPSLRNLEFTYPYMHDGRMQKLYQVLDHYSGITLQKADGTKVSVQKFSPEEKVDLMAFLLALGDRTFLYATKNQFPKEFFFSQPME